MLTSGEESAELTRMCNVIARHYERDTTTLTKNLSTVIEPVLIVLIAAVVLVVALGHLPAHVEYGEAPQLEGRWTVPETPVVPERSGASD
jgi:hypothetical protein